MSYESIIFEKSPFAGWWLDEAAGTAAADILGANNGTYVNGPALNVQPGPISREPGGWTTFNGSSQYVNCGTLGALGSLLGNGISVSAWVKSSVTNALMCLFGVADSQTNFFLIHFNRDQTGSIVAGKIQCYARNPALSTNVCATSNATGVTNGALHHVCVTYMPNPYEWAVYVDGSLYALTYSATSNLTNFANFANDAVMIGCFNFDGSLSRYFNGSIGRMAVYNRVLAQAEVTANYLSGLNGTPDKRLLLER